MAATFLTAEQIWGEDGRGQLEVIKKYAPRVGSTDLAAVLGGCMSRDYETSEGERCSFSWSASTDEFEYVSVRCVSDDGGGSWCNPDGR